MNLLSFPASGRLAAAISMSCFAASAIAQDLDTPWRLRVMDMQHQLKVEATVRFTSEAARSCMGSGWKRVAVDAAKLQAEDFFPLKTPLAFERKDNRLTFGRAEVCDGYQFLSGPANARKIEGSFDTVGWGSTQRGYFSLEKAE